MLLSKVTRIVVPKKTSTRASQLAASYNPKEITYKSHIPVIVLLKKVFKNCDQTITRSKVNSVLFNQTKTFHCIWIEHLLAKPNTYIQ